jgi:hypothetical protein
LRNFATCTEDLRFHSIDTVPADSILVRQGTSHWKAGLLLSGECSSAESSFAEDNETKLAETPVAAFSSYTQMLRSYDVDLATIQEA